MSDKSNLEKFLMNFVAGETEAAKDLVAQVMSSKTKRLVNEGDKKEEKETEKKDADDKKKGASEKEMDKTKPKVEDENCGDTKGRVFKKVDAKKAEGKQKTNKEE
jgi:hypothetical protein